MGDPSFYQSNGLLLFTSIFQLCSLLQSAKQILFLLIARAVETCHHTTTQDFYLQICFSLLIIQMLILYTHCKLLRYDIIIYS